MSATQSMHLLYQRISCSKPACLLDTNTHSLLQICTFDINTHSLLQLSLWVVHCWCSSQWHLSYTNTALALKACICYTALALKACICYTGPALKACICETDKQMFAQHMHHLHQHKVRCADKIEQSAKYRLQHSICVLHCYLSIAINCIQCCCTSENNADPWLCDT